MIQGFSITGCRLESLRIIRILSILLAIRKMSAIIQWNPNCYGYLPPMNGATYELVQQIAISLNAKDSPPIKDGIAYRIIVFKVKDEELWVAAMLPDIIEVEELFVVLNESYDMFLNGAKTPNGVIFLCSEKPGELVSLANRWYNDTPGYHYN